MRQLALTASLLLLALVETSGCARKAAGSPPPAPPPDVLVAKPVQKDEPIYGEWVGTVEGFVNAQVRAQVSGYLLKQHYAEGAAVKQGDLLFEVDARPFQNALDQATAAAQKAESDFRRQTELAGKQVASKQEFDNASAANDAARAALAQAKLNLEFTKVRSPIDGVAGLANAQIGDLVGPTTGVLTTVSTVDPIKVYFGISEQSYLQFQRQQDADHRFPEGMQLELILSDGTRYPQAGKFFAVDRQIDAATGTLRVAGTFPNPDRLLRPGQYARIRAQVSVLHGAILVPQRAVTELQGGYQVALVGTDQVVHLRPVKVGPRIGSNWVISEGLKPDETLVIEGLQKVREGTKVNAQPFSPGPATPTAQR